MPSPYLAPLLLAGALALPLAAHSAEPAPGKPIAVVNGVAIPALYAEVVREDRRARGLPADAISDEALRNALISVEVLAQAAQAKGLDKPERVRAILDLQRKETLIKLLQDDFVLSHKLSDADIQAEYERLKAKGREPEYRARHILVQDEKTAKDLIAQLSGKKARFEDLAKKHSKDASATAGGDLGWMSPSSLVPEFAQAMVALRPGEYSRSPVKSPFGWHVIKLEGVRQPEFPPLEQVKAQIANHLLQDAYRNYVNELQKAARIELPQ